MTRTKNLQKHDCDKDETNVKKTTRRKNLQKTTNDCNKDYNKDEKDEKRGKLTKGNSEVHQNYYNKDETK